MLEETLLYLAAMQRERLGLLLLTGTLACATPPADAYRDSGIGGIGETQPGETAGDDVEGTGNDGEGDGTSDGDSGDTGFSFDDEGTGDGTGGDGDPVEDSGNSCAELMVNLEQQIPTLVILIDRSTSMSWDFTQSRSRWEAVYDTLMDESTGTVQQLQSSIRLGLALYSSVGSNQNPPEVCPDLLSVPSTSEIDPGRRTAFAEVYDRGDNLLDNGSYRQTPTGPSISAIAADLTDLNVPGPKGILLATDGSPDTCSMPVPENINGGQAIADAETVEAAQLAFEAGVQTFVLSVGNGISEDHLQDMANAGAGLPLDTADPAEYYQALNAEDLVDDIQAIVDNFQTCRFTIDGTVALPRRCEGTVLFDGEPLECDTDWIMPDASTLEIVGNACDTLYDGEHTLDASWPCQVYIPG